MTPPRGVRIGIATIGSAAVVGGALLGVGFSATAASAIIASPSFVLGAIGAALAAAGSGTSAPQRPCA
ncbi:MAG TPA: hypothetical protein VFY91_09325 [Microbacterium sp.]|nr:hypothetical protein [Microbacterium sp.]